MATRASEGREA